MLSKVLTRKIRLPTYQQNAELSLASSHASQGNITMPKSPLPPLPIKFCKHNRSAIANVNANNVNRSMPTELNKVSKPNSLHGVYSYTFLFYLITNKNKH